jgi:ornithine cyclodeaminase/alanine dehydrogenase-like protein (mu-crystallin family)
MNPLFVTEDDVRALVSVPETVDILERAFRAQTTGEARNLTRTRLATGKVFLHILGGAVGPYFGYKAYTVGPGGARFLFHLFDSGTGDLLALMQADVLGQIRTGAATGLGTRFLARQDASVATLFGAGWQAESQLEAMAAVRNLERVWIVNRTPDKAARFIEKMGPRVNAQLIRATSPEDAVSGSQIVTTITGSREPVLFGSWIRPGTHINAAGGNMLLRKEVDGTAVSRSDLIVVDSIEQARIECGEFLGVMSTGRRSWDEIVELDDVVTGRAGRRSEGEITFFKSQGVGLEDVALGALVYERAVERNIGRRLDLS